MSIATHFARVRAFVRTNSDVSFAEHLRRIEQTLGTILYQQELIMIDTTKILAEVARERTDNASLRALQTQTIAALNTVKTQLAEAIASNDPAALAKVQSDLDQATTDLSLDNAATEAALKENVAPASDAHPASPASSIQQ